MPEARRMVLFTKNCSPYRSGERAAFNPRDAAKLVNRQVAEYCEATPKEAIVLANNPGAMPTVAQSKELDRRAQVSSEKDIPDPKDIEEPEEDDDDNQSDDDDRDDADGEGDEQPEAAPEPVKAAKPVKDKSTKPAKDKSGKSTDKSGKKPKKTRTKLA